MKQMIRSGWLTLVLFLGSCSSGTAGSQEDDAGWIEEDSAATGEDGNGMGDDGNAADDGAVTDHVADGGDQEGPQLTRVVLIEWDGCQRSHLDELLNASLLPNLQALINEGMRRNMRIGTNSCGCANDGVNHHTETGPAHAAMFTGYGFDLIKNHSNGGKEATENNCPSVCPAGSPPSCFDQLGPNPIPKGLTFFERLKVFNPAVRIGYVTGKDFGAYPFPGIQHIAPPSCCSRLGMCGDGDALDVCVPSLDEPNVVTTRGLDFLQQNQDSSFFLFIQLRNPDGVGHTDGENSTVYTSSIIDDDVQVGRVVQKLRDLGIYQQTVLMVTTDHGFEEGTKGHHACVPETRQIWIVSNRAEVIARQGVAVEQTSLTPTLFDIYGMSKNVTPPFYSESLHQ